MAWTRRGEPRDPPSTDEPRRTRFASVPAPPPNVADRHREFTALYERELPRQVRRATFMLGSIETAQDAVHDAFVSVYRHWDDPIDPGPLPRTRRSQPLS